MIEIPERMRHLPLDRRGYPIPVGVYRDENGRPHFQINDEPTRQRHMARELCPLCGGKLFRGRWFVGGPRAAFDPLGAYIDAPMHAECARFALQVCPFLAAPNYARRIEDRTLSKDHDGVLLVEEECTEQRPPLFVAVMTTGQIPVRFEGSRLIRFLRPKRPFSNVEYWQHGRQLSETEALPLIDNDTRAMVRKMEPKIGD